MTALQTAAAVLAKAALFDPTFSRPDPNVAAAWADALGDLPVQDCLDVVTAHYVTESRRIMPADVRHGVKRIRDARIANAVIPDPPATVGPDDIQAYLDWRRRTLTAIASGETVVTQLPDRELPSRPVQALLAAALRGKDMPAAEPEMNR